MSERDSGDVTLREVEEGLDARRVVRLNVSRNPGGGWSAEVLSMTDNPTQRGRRQLWSDSIVGILLAASGCGGGDYAR
jgi:hypothetical protein